jgi:hypothetical protein
MHVQERLLHEVRDERRLAHAPAQVGREARRDEVVDHREGALVAAGVAGHGVVGVARRRGRAILCDARLGGGEGAGHVVR